jgi:hypothetical protein
MDKETFKKKFQDVRIQELTPAKVLHRAKAEEIVSGMVKSLNTGLVYYEYDCETIKIFTSDAFRIKAEKMKKGDRVFHPHKGIEGTIISEEAFLLRGYMCIRVDFGGRTDAYDCLFFM